MKFLWIDNIEYNGNVCRWSSAKNSTILTFLVSSETKYWTLSTHTKKISLFFNNNMKKVSTYTICLDLLEKFKIVNETFLYSAIDFK